MLGSLYRLQYHLIVQQLDSYMVHRSTNYIVTVDKQSTPLLL
jgi:hypothetical protein